MMTQEYQRDQYTVSTDPSRFDVTLIHDYLSHSYWAEGIPLATVTRAMTHSLCFGLYADSGQIGFARVVTDHATFAYLADVFILDAYQGRGLGTWLIDCILAHPDLQGLRRWLLMTRDAHGLYRKAGFVVAVHPERVMEIARPGMYREGTI